MLLGAIQCNGEATSVNRRVVGSSPTCGAKVSNLGRPKGLPICFHVWVYILENAKGIFYIGQTSDLQKRLRDHNRTDCVVSHYTRKNGPWRLVCSEPHETRSSAVRRERQIKRCIGIVGSRVYSWNHKTCPMIHAQFDFTGG